MKKTLYFIFSLIALNTSIPVNAQNTLSGDSLLSDFNLLINLLESTHPDPYSGFGGRYFFHKEAYAIRNELQQKDFDRGSFASAITAFLSRIQDQHTFISVPREGKTIILPALPVRLKVYPEGLFIESAPQGSGIIGYRLVSINDIPVMQLLEKIAAMEACENKYGAYSILSRAVYNKNSLEKLLSDSTGAVTLTLEAPDNSIKEISYPLLTDEDSRQVQWERASTTPIISQSGNISYGFTDDDSKIMYFRMYSIMARENYRYTIENNWTGAKEDFASYYKSYLGKDMPDDIEKALNDIPSMSENFSDMLLEMKKHGAKSLIIDLRGNGGGWTPITLPTLYMLYGDKYLAKDMEIVFSRRVSPLLLQKYNMTLDEFNTKWGYDYKLGDFTFTQPENLESIEIKRNNFISNSMSETKPVLVSQQGLPLYEPENIYVITDVNTFSAAFHYTFYLWKMGAKVVGVPCRQAPNTYMESTQYQLPYTGLGGSISNSVQVFLPPDDIRAKVFYPDLMPDYKDYVRFNFDSNAEVLYLLEQIK